jgi:hypothetical protein
MIKVEPQRIQAMAKRKDSIPTFMKYAGSISGPADLSSRRGYSRGIGDKIVVNEISAEKVVAKKTQSKPEKSRRGKTRQAVSLQ